MEYVALTRWEWQILCAEGRIRMLGARVCVLAEEQQSSCDVYKLFALAPQFNLGDAHALVIAELLPEWDALGLPNDFGVIHGSQWLRLEGIRSFSPLIAAEFESLHEDAMPQAIVLDAPRFEPQWREWVERQTQNLTRRSADIFVRALRLGEWLPAVLEALNRRTGLDPGESDQRNDLIGKFLKNYEKILKDDLARDAEGTCAHAIVCATLWASFVCGRMVPAEESDLRNKLAVRFERYLKKPYGNANYLTSDLHSEFKALVQETPGAFNTLLTPTSIGIYLRFLVAIKFGRKTPPAPRDLVAAILRLQVLDGGPAAAICAYLIGEELQPEAVQQIVMALDGSRYPTVNVASAMQELHLVSFRELLHTASELFTDSDVADRDDESRAGQSLG